MLVIAEKENERNKVKEILKNHGLDEIVSSSISRKLFCEFNLEIQKRNNR